MKLYTVTSDQIASAAEAIARAMLDEPVGRYSFPAQDRFLVVHREVYRRTITRALDEGRVNAWGEPIVGVAVWLRRPAMGETPPPPPTETLPRPPVQFSAGETARLEQFDAVLHRLRKLARPDPHCYLDAVGVLPTHRGRGIATALLAAGHQWADSTGLPCSLDTFNDDNVRFYERRGYRTLASLPLPGSGLTGMAMRRKVADENDAEPSRP